MTREAARQALDSMEKTCALLRAYLDEPDTAAAATESLTPADVAALEKVSQSFVLHAINRNELRASKLGPRLWRIARSDYEEWRRQRLNVPRRRTA